MVEQLAPVPRSDEALIVFLRSEFVNGFTSVTLYDITDPEIKFIGVIDPRAKVHYAVKPGKYAFMVLATRTDFMEATVEAGKRYFVMVTSDTSTTKPHYSLVAVRHPQLLSSDFVRLESETKYTVKTARADEWYANPKNAASVAARREKFFSQWFRKSPQARASQMLRPEDGQ
jgi:hypothetical protein